MALIITKREVDFFRSVTSFDLEEYYSLFFNFTNNHRENVEQFFSGEQLTKNQQSFRIFQQLKNETSRLLNAFELNAKNLITVNYFQIMDQVSDISSFLQILSNYPKYQRTTLTNGNYSRRIKIKVNQSLNQSLEQISESVALNDNFQDDWARIAISNKATEEATKVDDLTILNVELGDADNFVIQTVFTGIQSIEDTYGKDINSLLLFEQNDFQALNPQQTIIQVGENLLGMIQGDDPYNPNVGINRNLLGQSVAGLVYDILINNIISSFQTDDSFSSVQVTNIQVEQDVLNVFVEARDQTQNVIQFNQRLELT